MSFEIGDDLVVTDPFGDGDRAITLVERLPNGDWLDRVGVRWSAEYLTANRVIGASTMPCFNCLQPNGEHLTTCPEYVATHQRRSYDEGVKFDGAKIPYHLIAPELLSAIAEILDFGQKKYSPRNWEKGMAWHRPFRACIGHLWDWWRKEKADPETGKSHLWHAACCIMFLVTYEARGIGTDDRP